MNMCVYVCTCVHTLPLWHMGVCLCVCVGGCLNRGIIAFFYFTRSGRQTPNFEFQKMFITWTGHELHNPQYTHFYCYCDSDSDCQVTSHCNRNRRYRYQSHFCDCDYNNSWHLNVNSPRQCWIENFLKWRALTLQGGWWLPMQLCFKNFYVNAKESGPLGECMLVVPPDLLCSLFNCCKHKRKEWITSIYLLNSYKIHWLNH